MNHLCGTLDTKMIGIIGQKPVENGKRKLQQTPNSPLPQLLSLQDTFELRDLVQDTFELRDLVE